MRGVSLTHAWVEVMNLGSLSVKRSTQTIREGWKEKFKQVLQRKGEREKRKCKPSNNFSNLKKNQIWTNPTLMFEG